MGSAVSIERKGEIKDRPIQYDPTFTDRVIAATGPNANPRLAEVMPGLIRHLHGFARESKITVAEWTAAVDFINECGHMSDDRRNETQLLCDVLGLESLVDETSSKLLSTGGTPSAILGPFYRSGAPNLPNGASIVRSLDPSVPWYDRAISNSTFIYGQVYSMSSKGKVPLAGATVDVWHTAPNGLYEQQDADQPDMNLRGRFTTDEKGHFSFYALRPVAYPVPDDGPAGRLLGLLDRHPYRPAHIHFIVEAPGHRTLTTQLFDADDKYIQNDSVFAVKTELMVKFQKREGDSKANWELGYDFTLSQDV